MLLAIESSTARGSVALLRAEGEIDSRWLPGERRHAETLAATVRDMVGEALAEIDLYAISVGPGSFTGLRIGLAFLKGLGLAHPAPVVAVSSLEALAFSAEAPFERRLAVLDARAGEVFAGLYACDGETIQQLPELPDGLYRPEAVVGSVSHDTLIVGDGASIVADVDSGIRPGGLMSSLAPSAVSIAKIADTRRDRAVALAELSPAYHQLARAEQRKLANGAKLPASN